MPTYNFKSNREFELDGAVCAEFEGPVVLIPRAEASTFYVKALNFSNVYYYIATNTFEIDGEAFEGTLEEYCDAVEALYAPATGLPSYSKADRDLLTPEAGMMIYQTDNTPGLRVYNGTNWKKFTETTD